ncbi:shikimate dehydrogenase [Fodinicola feengrottensis]|uniref:Shikimate dehydrogenase n=1 Tax=Fodinicola feengrottensis TaxID=435914 RepID=A0ABN2G3M9_9ACTN
MSWRCAVFGSPVRHSLSPVLHNAAYQALGLAGWHYDRVECDEAGLAPLLAGLGPEWAGLSLTMPLKREGLRLATAVSERAAAVGAANTLVPRDGGWYADNTDVAGIIDAVREVADRPFASAAVLGAGGTAQAAVAALPALGCTSVGVYVRDLARAMDVTRTAERVGVMLDVRPWASLPDGLAADLVVCTVPKSAAPALAEVAVAPGGVVMDVLYEPWPTPFALAAQKTGSVVLSGLDLLLHQAVHQVTLMTGHPGPLAAMRAALQSR